MLPVWMIDLGGSEASAKKLQGLLASLSDSQKPFWHYFHPKGTKPVSDETSLKALMDELVADGRECYNSYIKAGYPVNNFQVAILGAADERLTQTVFAPLPGLIRDYLPRIVSDHANLGVEVTGLLYIPSTINQLDDVRERKRAAMLMEDINMLTSTLSARHFNRVVAYQDVQYKGVRFYPGLSEEERTELLFQILCHLFLVNESSERLFDKIGQESGIFSLGAASVYYSSEQHQSYELKRLLDKLLGEFKEVQNTDEEYAGKAVREILEDKEVEPDSVSSRLLEGCGSLDLDLKKLDEEADPHPVWDLFRSDLIPSYYHKFLKFMPARLVRFMQSLSYVLLTGRADIIRKNRANAVKGVRVLLRSAYRKILLDNAAKYATISQLESFFREAKAFLGEKRAKVTLLLLEIVPVPKYLRNDYDKCLVDEDANKPAAILEKIKKNLKKEPIVLSLLVRCFLLGILLVFTVIPLIRVLSPKVINLGEIATIEWLWIPVLFFLPLVIEFFIKLRRHFKRIKRLKYRLLAATLLSVNKRLSKLLMDEEGLFYDELAAECDTQLGLLSQFRGILKSHDVKGGNKIIPDTLFNQSLIGGAFCGEKLIEDDSVTEAQIRIGDETIRLSQLEQKDLLVLLKSAFRIPETVAAADLGDGKAVAEHADNLVASFDGQFGPELEITTAEDMGSMFRMLDGKVNINALVKMAGVNGMLFAKLSDNQPVVRITNAPVNFSDSRLICDADTKDYVLFTTWQKLPVGITSQMVCNCQLEPLPALSFTDMLSLYYGYYRRKDLAYTLAGSPVRIPREEMDKLDKQIIGG
mgnify:CR=1 FL=1